MGFDLERLFCSSQAKTNSLGFPTKNLFTTDLSHPLPLGQDHLKQFPNPAHEGLDLSWGLPWEMVTGGIEPCFMV